MSNPKFRVGQVVRVRGTKKLRSFLPDYFRIAKVAHDNRSAIYRVSEHDEKGPWVMECSIRALTKREQGQSHRNSEPEGSK